MPIPAPQPTNLPDEIQISQILIVPQAPTVQFIVELLKQRTRTVTTTTPPDEEGEEPTVSTTEVPYTETIGHRQVQVKDVTALMNQPVQEGETVYEALKRVCNGWVAENFTL